MLETIEFLSEGIRTFHNQHLNDMRSCLELADRKAGLVAGYDEMAAEKPLPPNLVKARNEAHKEMVKQYTLFKGAFSRALTYIGELGEVAVEPKI